MARIARVVVSGVPHHVTQRGNRRMDVFFGDEDRQAYLDLLREFGKKHGVRYWGYCLMSNHVHLIGVPEFRGHTTYLLTLPAEVGRSGAWHE